MKRVACLASAVLLVGVVGCAKYQTIQVPPRIDLKPHEMIGVVEFEATNEGDLGPLATRRFTESARRDQGMVRMVGVGSKDEALRSVDHDRLAPASFRALGREYGVQTILVGRVEVSDVRPDISVSGTLRSGSLSALVDATLAVELIEASTGASLWSTSARASKSVSNITVFGAKNFAFDAEDPERAYGVLIDALVEQAARDFHATWERRRLN
jgi:hypothetical protein